MLPALFFFVPGNYLSAATAELAAGYLTTGAVRLVYAVFLLLQLYLGVILALMVTGRDRHALFDVAAHGDLPRWALFLAWIVFTCGTLLAFAIPARLLPRLLLLVYLTVGVQSLATKLVGEVGATFAAAVALGAAATLISHRPRPAAPSDPAAAGLLHPHRRIAGHARPDRTGRRLPAPGLPRPDETGHHRHRHRGRPAPRRSPRPTAGTGLTDTGETAARTSSGQARPVNGGAEVQ